MNASTQGTAPRKGLSNLAWIGIGCAVVMLMAVIVIGAFLWWGVNKAQEVAKEIEANPAKAAAKMIVMANPELEEVSTDDEEGTITIRNRETGELITVNFEDIKEGKLSFSSGDKEFKIDASGGEDGTVVKVTGDDAELSFATGERTKGERPDWVPVYPETEPGSEHVMLRPEGLNGGFEVKTSATVDEVAAFYRSALENGGFQVTHNTMSGPQADSAMIHASKEADGRTVVVAVNAEDGETTIGVTYNERR